MSRMVTRKAGAGSEDCSPAWSWPPCTAMQRFLSMVRTVLEANFRNCDLAVERIAQQQDVDVASPVSAIWKPLHAAARRLEAEDLRVAEA